MFRSSSSSNRASNTTSPPEYQNSSGRFSFFRFRRTRSSTRARPSSAAQVITGRELEPLPEPISADDPIGPPPPYDYETEGAGPSFGRCETAIDIPASVLENLRPVYYCLYSGSSILPTTRPDPVYPVLSVLYLEHVCPPTTANELIRHACFRENLDSSGAKLFVKERIQMSRHTRNQPTRYEFGSLKEVPSNTLIVHSREHPGCRDNPYQVVLPVLERTEWEVSCRRVAGLPLSGLIDTLELEDRVRRNILTAPRSGGTYNAANKTPWAPRTVYYRLYWVQGCTAMSSIKPLYPADPSVAQTCAEYVSPPRCAQNYIDHIAALEGFHSSRVCLYERRANGGLGSMPIDPSQQVALTQSGPGSATSPILVLIDVCRGLEGQPDRKVGATPLHPVTSLGYWLEALAGAHEIVHELYFIVWTTISDTLDFESQNQDVPRLTVRRLIASLSVVCLLQLALSMSFWSSSWADPLRHWLRIHLLTMLSFSGLSFVVADLWIYILLASFWVNCIHAITGLLGLGLMQWNTPVLLGAVACHILYKRLTDPRGNDELKNALAFFWFMTIPADITTMYYIGSRAQARFR